MNDVRQNQKVRSSSAPPLPNINPEQFVRVRDVLADYSGLYLDTARQRMLETSMGQRMAATGLTLEKYLALISGRAGRAEIQLLAELVVNHETVFFRNVPHMRALRESVLLTLHRSKPVGQPLRIWSAGCATGEEPYSLAITVLETLGWPLPRPVEVWATDLSSEALAKARAGVYRGRAINAVAPAIRAHYFRPQGDGWAVSEGVRRLVRFEQLNLLDPFPPAAQDIDLIFCQNVTIYFQLETCRALMERFHGVLPQGGLLFLGFSETLWNIFDGFQSRDVNGAFVYYKGLFPGEPRPAPPRPARPAPTRPLPPPPPRRHTAPMRSLPVAAPRAPDESPAQAALQRGRDLLANGEAELALDALRAVPPSTPYAPAALALAARAHANRGDTDLAVAEARRALEIDTLLPDAELLLGMLYSQQHQWPAATQHLERARYLDPASATVSFHLAECYRRTDRLEAAAREYRNTIHKLDAHPPDQLLDGVAVGWVRDTCQRYLQLMNEGR